MLAVGKREHPLALLNYMTCVCGIRFLTPRRYRIRSRGGLKIKNKNSWDYSYACNILPTVWLRPHEWLAPVKIIVRSGIVCGHCWSHCLWSLLVSLSVVTAGLRQCALASLAVVLPSLLPSLASPAFVAGGRPGNWKRSSGESHPHIYVHPHLLKHRF